MIVTYLGQPIMQVSRKHRTEAIILLQSLPCYLYFHDDSKSIGMIWHSMGVIKQAVQKLNSAQVPVITLDQPLYALAKMIQWNWKESHGEDKYVIMLGGLHIEIAGLKVIGDWLEHSGWVEALVKALLTHSLRHHM